MKNLVNNLHTTFKSFLMVSVLAATTTSYGDDTEVFYSVNAGKPNLLFVLDISSSMNNIVPGSGTVISGSGSIERQTLERSISSGEDDAEEKPGQKTYVNSSDLELVKDGKDQIIGLRFKNIPIDQGGDIYSAYIQFDPDETNDRSTNLNIAVQAADDPEKFKKKVDNIGDRVLYDQRVTWDNVPAWPKKHVQGSAQRTPDIQSLVKLVVDRSGWEKGNSIVFVISGSGKRVAESYEGGGSSRAPRLVIEYMGTADDEVGEDKTRMQVMQNAFRAVMETAPDNINIGLMNYGQGARNKEGNDDYRHHAVSGVAYPVKDSNALAWPVISASESVHNLPRPDNTSITVNNYLALVVDDWETHGGTPIVDALYEAALYMRGENMHYGKNDAGLNGAHPSTYEGSVITQDVRDVGRSNIQDAAYKSPITSRCQSNYIVLMSDGGPHYSGKQGLVGPYARFIKGDASYSNLAGAVSSCASRWSDDSGTCGPEITRYIADHDNIPDPSASNVNGLEEVQTIKTFSIGFSSGIGASDRKYMVDLATYDDPDTTEGPEVDAYFDADNEEKLVTAFRSILEEISEPKGTLASPGYSVNVKNGLEHENDIYIPVFDRKNTSRWSGNLKKFKLEHDTDINGNKKRYIRGKNGLNATNELGSFTTSTLDYWSESSNTNPDGKDVQKGGVASLLDPEDRRIFSNLTGNTNISLSSGANEVSLDNISNLTNSVLGLDSSSTLDQRKTLVNFMRGWKDGVYNESATPHGEARHHMGDMLHSEPLVVTYNKGAENGDGKRQYIFAATNEGYLHAFDTSDTGVNAGKEMFAFIPEELLSTISEPQFRNEGTQADHKYGVDGALTVWFKDDGVKGVVDGSDQVIVYFGLRRGGSSFYALDVTDIDSPILLWTKSKTDYDSMGQSWSTPYLVKVGVGSSKTPTEVMIVSGGYDEDEDRDLADGTVDDAQIDITADEGNDILILNAKTGAKIWSMPSSMRSQISSSIPGGVRVLDTNYNGLVDRMYFADTGGNVWRLDLSEKITIGDSSTPESDLTKLAELGGTGENARKFYNEPDVAKMKLNGRTVFAVSVGSGFRAHPMDKTIDDKFFVLIDKSPFRPLVKTGPEDGRFNTITTAPEGDEDLAELTISGTAISNTNSIKDLDKRGWKVNFGEVGEKVLGVALAFDGNITFTSLVPEVLTSGEGIDICAAPITQSRFYVIDILNGKAGADLSGNGGVPNDSNDVFLTTSTEILGRPQVVYNPLTVSEVLDADGAPTGEQTCRHPVDIRTGKKLTQSTGYDACRLESVYWSDPVSE